MKGFKFNGISAGIKSDNILDLGIIFSEKPAVMAALFTKNKIIAAPVILGKKKLKNRICQAILVNSGNANCCTGDQGLKDAMDSAEMVAKILRIDVDNVMVSSTGVIGQRLPMERIRKGIPRLIDDLETGDIDNFARSILTTDTTIKKVEKKCDVNDHVYTIVGIAKGSGMIKPDMATMLAYILTDAHVPHSVLQQSLQRSCDKSFNRISIDGDTSTNDTVICMANGMSRAIIEDHKDIARFNENLDHVLFGLSEKIVRDGEGATKLAKIVVKGAESSDDAFMAAQAIADSSLVKTALFGEDPNWGRIVAAAGRSGAALEMEKIDLLFDDVYILDRGSWCGQDAEALAHKVLKKSEYKIVIDFNLGDFDDYYLFCDFSMEYVKINADYRS